MSIVNSIPASRSNDGDARLRQTSEDILLDYILVLFYYSLHQGIAREYCTLSETKLEQSKAFASKENSKRSDRKMTDVIMGESSTLSRKQHLAKTFEAYRAELDADVHPFNLTY